MVTYQKIHPQSLFRECFRCPDYCQNFFFKMLRSAISVYQTIAVESSCPILFSFFSIYCRPSLVFIPIHFESIFYFIPPAIKKHAIFGIDCNAKSKAWNSVHSHHIGVDRELCFLNNALSVSNVNLTLLSHKPSYTSFVDVTLAGDSVSLDYGKNRACTSLFDHPFISFRVPFGCHVAPPARTEVRLPFPPYCNMPLLLTNLEASLATMVNPSTIQTFTSLQGIEAFIANLTDSIKSAALKNKLPFYASRHPGRMPW